MDLTYEDGANDARSVQKAMKEEPKRPPEVIWFSPGEILFFLLSGSEPDMEEYYRGYLSRWD